MQIDYGLCDLSMSIGSSLELTSETVNFYGCLLCQILPFVYGLFEFLSDRGGSD